MSDYYLKTRLILPFQDNVFASFLKQVRDYITKNKLVWAVPTSLSVVLIVILPIIAVSAGNISSVELSKANIPRENNDYLEAALAVNPAELPRGGGSPLMKEDSILVSDIGPITMGEKFETPGVGQISTRIVRGGDTLSQIAQQEGVSVQTILWANDLGINHKIQPGDSLIILPVSGVNHTIKKGDTLAGIAKRYKGEVAEITRYNNLSGNKSLIAGEEIIIPYGVIPEPVHRVAPTATSQVASMALPINTSIGTRSQGLHGYNAIDWAAPIGTSVYAAQSGEVIVSRRGGWNGGYGNYIVIRHHGGVQTLYAHLNSINVANGQRVATGQVIGTIGSTGRSTGPHLHFEVRGGVNPLNY